MGFGASAHAQSASLPPCLPRMGCRPFAPHRLVPLSPHGLPIPTALGASDAFRSAVPSCHQQREAPITASFCTVWGAWVQTWGKSEFGVFLESWWRVGSMYLCPSFIRHAGSKQVPEQRLPLFPGCSFTWDGNELVEIRK